MGSMWPDRQATTRENGDESYIRRVARALDRARLGGAALVTLLLSAEALSVSEGLGFFSLPEIAVLWLEHLVELAAIAGVLTLAYTLLEQAMWQRPPRWRLAISCAMLLVLSIGLTYLL